MTRLRAFFRSAVVLLCATAALVVAIVLAMEAK